MNPTRQFVRAALVLLITAAPALAWAAAHVALEVNTQTLTVDDELRVTVRASGTFDEMTEPEVAGWEIRRAGQQQQLSVIGGSMQRTESVMYVATPSKPGKFKFGPVVLLESNVVVAKSDVVTVEVVAPQAAQLSLPPERATDLSSFTGIPFFVHPTLSTNQPYVGQPFVVSWALYWSRQRSVAGIRPLAEPNYGKLEPESLRDDAMARAETIMLSGQPYQRQTTHRDLLVATAPGPLRLEAPRFRIETLDARSPKLSSPNIDLQVRPIPTQGRPQGFVDGNVGRLRIAATLQSAGSKTVQPAGTLDVQTGERLLLTVTVSGDGNLLGLRPLTLPTIDGMTAEMLARRDDAGIARDANGIRGTQTWQWMLSFGHPGHVQIPEIGWASFDPYQERFDTQSVGPYALEVHGPAPAPVAVTATEDGAAGTPPAVRARDRLRPNAEEAKLSAGDGRTWTQSLLFHAFLALPWLVAAATLVAFGIRRQKERDAPERQRRAALPEVQERLRATATTEPAHGYAEARRVVSLYLRQVAQLEMGGLTEQGAVDELQRLGVPQEMARQLAADLQHCDFGRFAPAGDRQTDLAQTTERLSQNLRQIDGVLLRTPLPAAIRSLAVLILLTASLFAPGMGHAATVDETFVAGNQAYARQEYATAKACYDSLLSHNLPAAAIRYNLGNTLVQLEQLGRAVAQYQAALQLQPDTALKRDIQHNLQAVRAELTDRARRHHATLHVFDESASLDIMFAQSAPRGALGGLALLAGLLASGLLAAQLLGGRINGHRGAWRAAIAAAAALHVLALATLVWADAEREALVQAVVIEEDAQLVACQAQAESEDLGLPEGLEVRMLAEMADGRVQVRLPNGREGCLPAASLELEATSGR